MSNFTWYGFWSSGITYSANTFVTHQNTIYVSLLSNTNSEPTSGNTNWDVVVYGQGNTYIERTPLPTVTPTNTPTPTITSTNTPTNTVTPTPTITNTPTNTVTPTISLTPTNTITPTVTQTPSITPTNTITPTISLTPSITPTNTITPTISLTPSITPTKTVTPTISLTPSITPTKTVTPSITPTNTPTPTRPAFIYYRWQITETKIMPPDNNCTQAAEFVFQIGGVDQSMSGVTVTNPNGNNPVGETPPNLVDGNLTTKALDGNFITNGLTNFIFQFSSAKAFTGYRWATANDFEDRDPKSWTIAGSNNGTTWTTLSTVSTFTATVARQTYQTPQTY